MIVVCILTVQCVAIALHSAVCTCCFYSSTKWRKCDQCENSNMNEQKTILTSHSRPQMRMNTFFWLLHGSDRTGRDDVEISRGSGQSACSCRFIRVKARETNIQRMLYSMLEVHSSISDKSLCATDMLMWSVSWGASICSPSVVCMHVDRS